MMETVRQIERKLTKDKKKRSKFLGLFLVFRECVAIKVNHKKYHYGQRYLDVWIGKVKHKNLPLCQGFSSIYVDHRYEDYKQNERLPYELLSIRIDDTAIEFNFVKSAERPKMPRFKYEDGKNEN